MLTPEPAFLMRSGGDGVNANAALVIVAAAAPMQSSLVIMVLEMMLGSLLSTTIRYYYDIRIFFYDGFLWAAGRLLVLGFSR